MTFTDVSIQSAGTTTITIDTYTYCLQIFRTPEIRTRFKFQVCPKVANQKLYILTNGERIEKTSECWGCPFVSEQPLEEQRRIIYFEIKIVENFHAYGGGIVVGITEDNQHMGSRAVSDTEMVVYLSMSGNMHFRQDVVCYKSVESVAGDVIGVVLDRMLDEVRFYLNGKLVAKSIRRPASLKSVYAYTNIFYWGQKLEICKKYLYRDLSNKI